MFTQHHKYLHRRGGSGGGGGKKSPDMANFTTDNGHYYHHTTTTTTTTTQLQAQWEVCSSFYTNNPLLYVSHYSEIIVHAAGPEGGPAAVARGLSGRRELVEQLDAEPLYDYLVQNGVLENSSVADLRQEQSPAKTNLALLQKVEEHGRAAQGLLIIGLRQTGQHYLANLLDDTDRIKALSGSGYLSKSRHKGQLRLKVQVRAIKLAPESFRATSGEILSAREWVSLDDVLLRNLPPSGRPTPAPTPTGTSLQTLDETVPDDDTIKPSCCLCGCFSKLFSKSKNKKLDKPNGSAKKYLETEVIHESAVDNVPSQPLKRASSERIRSIDNVFRQRSADFYTLLADMSSDVNTLLLKFFEQERGLLVLDAAYENDGLVVTSICTTAQQFSELRQSYTAGKLTSDLERWIVTEETLRDLGARGLKLHIDCPGDDLDQVEQELS